MAIKKCDCIHKFQDEVYGKGNRVHNPMGEKQDKFRCSVCEKQKDKKEK